MNVDQTMAVISAVAAVVIRRNWVNHGSLK